tara:strand:- start:107 stop:604 length:498 start_codon:yes stop_codon:yes gene_type:complete
MEKVVKKIAIYPGTFDQITNGHYDIIKRSSALFDELIIAVTDDNNKKVMFDISERIDMVKNDIRGLENIRVEQFSGLLMNYAQSVSANVIIRGLRVLSDFEYEFKMAMMNRGLNDTIDTLFLMPNRKYVHISSSLIKEVALLGGDMSDYVSPVTLERILKKVENR